MRRGRLAGSCWQAGHLERHPGHFRSKGNARPLGLAPNQSKEEKREDMRSFLKPLLTIAAMALGMTAIVPIPAWALVELNVNKGNVEPLPIAITDFQGGDALG